MEKYFKMLKESGADLAIKIAAGTIVTAAWTGSIAANTGVILTGKVIAVRQIVQPGKKRGK